MKRIPPAAMQVHQKKPAKCKFCPWVETGFTSLDLHVKGLHKEEYKKIREGRLGMEAKIQTFHGVVVDQESGKRNREWE